MADPGGGGSELAVAIGAEAVVRAERAASEVVRCVQPTAESERLRDGVIDYARRLIGAALGCEIFAYGSVPLKTYLPDGDIDLTVLGNTSYDSTLVNDVHCILEAEEQSSDAGFEVKDVQFINAEVRLIKCTIENIIVDISFNQTGGICALCFLELVDCQVGRNHLFKRSVILIKAWCYYESRLLGAHHGLISTYALETLILYIFNLFHKSLHGPLEVLHRFLEYFSKFDWDNYCISLNGPVALSSLPKLIVEAIDIPDDDLLFDKDLLKGPVDKDSVPQRGSDGCYTKFRPKHLNIIDPLKEHNNLGRSVSRASFHRIRTAFSYGAKKLSQILVLPSELIHDEVCGFFKNTLGRHGRGENPDLGNDGALQSFLGPGKTLQDDISSMKISYKKEDESTCPCLSQVLASKNSNVKVNGPTSSGRCFPGDTQDHTWNEVLQCRKSTSEDHRVVTSTGLLAKSSHFVHYAPKQYSSFCQENENGDSKQGPEDHEMEGQFSHTKKASHVGSRAHILTSPTHGSTFEASKSGPTDKTNWTDLHAENPSSLPDLSGDLDLQLRCLRQVQYHLEYLFDGFLQSVQEAYSADMLDEDSFNIPALTMLWNTDVTLPWLSSPSSTDTDGRNSSPVSCSHSAQNVSQQPQDEDHWDVACRQSISLPSGTYIPSNEQSLSSFFADSESLASVSCHSSEDTPKMHGTGTYIPQMSYDTYKERMTSLRANGQTLIKLPLDLKNNKEGNLYKNSLEIGSFVPNNELVTAESTRYQMPMKQNNTQKDVYTKMSSIPKGSFVPHKERVTADSKTKQIPTNQPLKVQNNLHGYFCSDTNLIEKQSCDTCNETRQILRYQPLKVQNSLHWDVYWNKNLQSYGTNIEFVLPATATKQIPKYQPLKVRDAPPNEAKCFKNNFTKKKSYDTPKKQATLDWETTCIPTCEPLKLQNSLQGSVCSNKILIEKQNYNGHKEHLAIGRAAKHIPGTQPVQILNSLERAVNSNKDLVEKGSQLRSLSPKVPLSHYSGNGQGKLRVSYTCQPSFPGTKGYSQFESLEMPQETVEFGSLGPVSLRFYSSESSKAPDTHSTKVCTGTSVKAGATQSRSPEFDKLIDEDDFPPRRAGSC